MITIDQQLTTKSGLVVPTGSKLKVTEFYLDRLQANAADHKCTFSFRLFKDQAAIDVDDPIYVKEFDAAGQFLLSEVVAILQDPDTQLDHAERVIGKYLDDKNIQWS